jgi:hypothetical protein
MLSSPRLALLRRDNISDGNSDQMSFNLWRLSSNHIKAYWCFLRICRNHISHIVEWYSNCNNQYVCAFTLFTPHLCPYSKHVWFCVRFLGNHVWKPV